MGIAAGHLLIREAAEDTVLEIPKPHGQVGTITIPIPKGLQVSWLYKIFTFDVIYGLQVIIDMVGLRTFSFITIPYTVANIFFKQNTTLGTLMNLRNTNRLVGIILPTTNLSQLLISVC